MGLWLGKSRSYWRSMSVRISSERIAQLSSRVVWGLFGRVVVGLKGGHLTNVGR